MVQRYRLFVQAELAKGNIIRCEPAQAHYLLTVLRLKAGAIVGIFNGQDGEWEGELQLQGRKSVSTRIKSKVRDQTSVPDLMYLFAPLKRARLDYMVQKATEMGVSVLQPVITQHTNVYRLKMERMALNAIEAAEQCNLLSIPEVREPVGLEDILESWPADRCLIYCDERAGKECAIEALKRIDSGPIALLIGPEGGFSKHENEILHNQPFVVPISLGPRIMRADTAAVAALALIQATLGDWRK
jgi:16S rRNA (uracil1498-N3)-methyltransferase